VSINSETVLMRPSNYRRGYHDIWSRNGAFMPRARSHYVLKFEVATQSW